MREIIAKIKLARDQVGFYDPLTNIHLTITEPVANVFSGMNVSGLKRSVISKRLEVIVGSLDGKASIVNPVQEEVKVKTTSAVEMPIVEKVVIDEGKVVEQVETEAQPVSEEEVQPAEEKKTSKKKSKKSKVEEA